MIRGMESVAKEMELSLALILTNLGPDLELLALRNHVISNVTGDIIKTLITNCSSLSKVFLIDVQIEDITFSQIMVRLAVLGTVKTLTLDNCIEKTSEENRSTALRGIEKVLGDNQIESLTIGHINFQGLEITSLLKVLSSMSSLRHLCLQGPRMFNEETTLDVLAAVTCLTSLRTLRLLDFGLTQLTVPMLSECIWELVNLETLELVKNDIGHSRAFRQLCRVCGCMKSLKRITMEECGITDRNAEFLASLFQKINLRSLSLMGNDICCTESVTQQLMKYISYSTSIRHLHLYFARFSLPLAELLADSLSGNRFLEELSISCKPTQDLIDQNSFQKAYRVFVRKLPSLTAFRLGFASDSRANHAPRKTHHERWRDECLEL